MLPHLEIALPQILYSIEGFGLSSTVEDGAFFHH